MPQRILVADDDRVFGEAIGLYLGRHGYETRWVADGSGVLAALEQGHWDVLVTDISMPGNEGLELLSALKGAPYPLPVILVTGHPTLSTAITSLRHDAVDYLTKPLDFGKLGEAVGRAIERRRTLEAVSRAREQLEEWSSTLASLQSVLLPSTSAAPAVDRGAPRPAERPVEGPDPLAGLDPEARASLSPREEELLLALAEGVNTRDLARRFFISEHTVRNHLKAIYRKLGVHSRTELFSRMTAWNRRS